jgi:hypothetical protein
MRRARREAVVSTRKPAARGADLSSLRGPVCRPHGVFPAGRLAVNQVESPGDSVSPRSYCRSLRLSRLKLRNVTMRFAIAITAAISILTVCSSSLDAAEKTNPVEKAKPDAKAKPAAPDPGPGWGTLPLQFIYDGDAPEPEVVTPVNGAETCGKFKIFDEELLVDKKTKGLANVVVTLNHKRKDLPEKLPVVVQNLAKNKVRMTNKACRFEPHVAVVWTEQKMELANNDPGVHNMLFNVLYNRPFNEVLQPNSVVEKSFTRAEKLPRPISCGIHPFMVGWVVLKDHPYAAVSGQTGEATIAHLPVGTWEFQLWHEKSGYLSRIDLNGKAVTGTKGVYEWTVKSGKNEPLRIAIDPAVF